MISRILSAFTESNVSNQWNCLSRSSISSSQGLSVSFICTLSSNRIEVPARGKRCHHFRCFDLLTLIKLNYSNRRWECPLCKEHTYELMVDPKLKSIIDKDTRAIAVNFEKDGNYRLIYP
jgi:hypothetical protein